MQLVIGDEGGERKAQARAAIGNGRRTNGADGKTVALEMVCGGKCSVIGAEYDGNDLAGAGSHVKISGAQSFAAARGTIE
jgi:hypothetical protein